MLGKIIVAQGNAQKVLVGKDKFEVTQQEALLETSDGQRRKFKLSIAPGASPYQVGEYSISDESLVVTEYGSLGLARNVLLIPLKAASLAKAS